MAQAILTKYLGPTDKRGTRILAEAQAGKIIIPYDYGLDYGLDDDNNHKKAALELIRKVGWGNYLSGGLAHGVLPNGDHVHVFKK